MKIGIKYCGGCNPRYDRSQEVEKLKKKFPQHTFTSALYNFYAASEVDEASLHKA